MYSIYIYIAYIYSINIAHVYCLQHICLAPISIYFEPKCLLQNRIEKICEETGARPNVFYKTRVFVQKRGLANFFRQPTWLFQNEDERYFCTNGAQPFFSSAQMPFPKRWGGYLCRNRAQAIFFFSLNVFSKMMGMIFAQKRGLSHFLAQMYFPKWGEGICAETGLSHFFLAQISFPKWRVGYLCRNGVSANFFPQPKYHFQNEGEDICAETGLSHCTKHRLWPRGDFPRRQTNKTSKRKQEPKNLQSETHKARKEKKIKLQSQSNKTSKGKRNYEKKNNKAREKNQCFWLVYDLESWAKDFCLILFKSRERKQQQKLGSSLRNRNESINIF